MDSAKLNQNLHADGCSSNENDSDYIKLVIKLVKIWVWHDNDIQWLHFLTHSFTPVGVTKQISRHLLCFLAILLVLMGSQWFNGRSLCHCIPHLPIPPGSRGTSDYLRSSGMTVVGSAGVRVPLLGERQQIPDWERFCINKSIDGREKWSPSSSKVIKRSSKRLWPRTKSIEIGDVNLPCRSAYHIYSCSKTLQKSAGKIFTQTWKWRLCRWNMIFGNLKLPQGSSCSMSHVHPFLSQKKTSKQIIIQTSPRYS